MNPYSRLVPRLNGKEIEEKFSYYVGLVKKGVAGFIVFGGELETVRARLAELQAAAHHPLIIASDLEQGLGQQIKGGTVFPPAMAIASALRGAPGEEASSMLEKIYTAFAAEAHYAGINTILAPVLDINTNPDNPIIATRAFGEDPVTVSFFGCEMIKVLQRNGIIACGKHFPGHGDTEVDSHISLPVVGKDLHSLEQNEFVPFNKAISDRVGMIMLGHLSVPALDPSGRPASLSDKAVSYLRDTMRFRGLIITDAMNMGGIGQYTEKEASLIALGSGVDIILHPSDPDAVASYLIEKNCRLDPLQITPHPPLLKSRSDISPDFASHQRLSDEIAGMAIVVEGANDLTITKPFLIILKEDKLEKDEHFVNALKQKYARFQYCCVTPGDEIPWSAIPKDHDLLVSVFSQVRAWKGQTAAWIRESIERLDGRARLFISFGNPYVLRNLENVTKIYAYWNSESAQKAVAKKLLS
jgi:beta-glucosidase-like glycosyl hydrolase